MVESLKVRVSVHVPDIGHRADVVGSNISISSSECVIEDSAEGLENLVESTYAQMLNDPETNRDDAAFALRVERTGVIKFNAISVRTEQQTVEGSRLERHEVRVSLV